MQGVPMIRTGLEVFLDKSEEYRGRRIALIANQTCVTSDLEYGWDALRKRGISLVRIFTPEHGLFATEQDQKAVHRQPGPDVDLVSLYGDSYDTLLPDPKCIEDIDMVIFDIQDVGARYYTYVNTMALFMKRLQDTDIEFIVLDRPNPLGGMGIEGPLLQEGFESFVGILPVAVRHGMTPGELALLYRDGCSLRISPAVMRMEGWKREMRYRETGLPWVPPSPNMPTEDTACRYPGFCLIEGTSLSEGRGTTMPFSVIGAPSVNPDELASRLNGFGLAGVYFRPVYFKPTFHKYADTTVAGVFVHITDLQAFHSFQAGVALVKTVFDLYGDEMLFLTGVYEFNDRHPAFDLLAGSSLIREMIVGGSSLDEIFESWRDDEKRFMKTKEKYHLY